METCRTVIAQSAQKADELVPDRDVRAAEVPKTIPYAIGPFERRESRRREKLEHRLIRLLQRDCSPKERNMVGFCDHKEYINGDIGHGDSYRPTRYFAER